MSRFWNGNGNIVRLAADVEAFELKQHDRPDGPDSPSGITLPCGGVLLQLNGKPSYMKDGYNPKVRSASVSVTAWAAG